MNRTPRTDEGLLDQFFHTMMTIPMEYYYFATLGSIAASAFLYLTGKRHTALFVGQWAPTFLVSALFYKLLHPAHENVGEQVHEAVGNLGR
jgi:hypothetical protein